MTTTTTPDATIPRDVRDMHRGQLEAEVVRLRAEMLRVAEATGIVYAADGCGPEPGPIYEIVRRIHSLAFASDKLLDAQVAADNARDRASEARMFAHDALNDLRTIRDNLTATQARCTELLLENRELKARSPRRLGDVATALDLDGYCEAERPEDVTLADLVQAHSAHLADYRRLLEAQFVELGITLHGWTCPDCRTFNGEAKERLLICRACTTPRPTGEQSVAGGIVESTRGTR